MQPPTQHPRSYLTQLFSMHGTLLASVTSRGVHDFTIIQSSLDGPVLKIAWISDLESSITGPYRNTISIRLQGSSMTLRLEELCEDSSPATTNGPSITSTRLKKR